MGAHLPSHPLPQENAARHLMKRFGAEPGECSFMCGENCAPGQHSVTVSGARPAAQPTRASAAGQQPAAALPRWLPSAPERHGSRRSTGAAQSPSGPAPSLTPPTPQPSLPTPLPPNPTHHRPQRRRRQRPWLGSAGAQGLPARCAALSAGVLHAARVASHSLHSAGAEGQRSVLPGKAYTVRWQYHAAAPSRSAADYTRRHHCALGGGGRGGCAEPFPRGEQPGPLWSRGGAAPAGG